MACYLLNGKPGIGKMLKHISADDDIKVFRRGIYFFFFNIGKLKFIY